MIFNEADPCSIIFFSIEIEMIVSSSVTIFVLFCSNSDSNRSVKWEYMSTKGSELCQLRAPAIQKEVGFIDKCGNGSAAEKDLKQNRAQIQVSGHDGCKVVVTTEGENN